MRLGIWLSGVGAGLWLGSMLTNFLTPQWLLVIAVILSATGLWMLGEDRARRRKAP